MERTKLWLIFLYEDGDGYNFARLSDNSLNNGQEIQELNLRISCFKTKLFKKGVTPGAIFEIEADDKQIYYKASLYPSDVWANDSDKAIWKLKNTAFKDSKRRLKYLNDDQVKEILGPIKDAYRSVSYSEKNLILAAVIRILTS